MMRKMKGNIDWQLIRKKINGSLSEEENNLLREWAESDSLRQDFLVRVENFYQKKTINIPNEQQIDKAWQCFKTNQTKSAGLVSKRWSIWAVAAAVVIVFCYWQWFFQPQSQQTNESVIAAANIPPGCSKGSLILSDGTTIPLGTTQKYRQITDKNTTIRMDSSGIIYDKRQSVSETVYNTIKIPQGGEYRLILADGTVIWLNSETELTYPTLFTGKERRIKLTGEAYLEVARDTAHPFIVEAGIMQIKVLGTSFNIHAYDDEPSIVTTLVSGRVSISTGERDRCILTPSQQVNFNKEKGSVEVKTVKTSLYTQWKEGRFVFRDKTLKEIMQVLSRWYDMKYEFLDTETTEIIFNGTINRYEQVKELLEQFEKTGRVRFSYSGKNVLISK